MAKLTIRKIDATRPDPRREIRLWDDDPRGFGVRIKPSGVKTFFLQFRSPVDFEKRRLTLGQYGDLTLEKARTLAHKEKGRVADGKDPVLEKRQARQHAQATALTVSELCDQYLRDARAGKVTYRGKPKKPNTIDFDAGRIRWHVKPLLGDKLVRDVTGEDVERLFHDIRLGKTAVKEKTGPRGVARVTGGDGAARRTVGLLGSIFSYAVRRKLRSDNPCKGIERGPDKRRDRVLSPQEYKALGGALETLSDQSANLIAVSAVRAVALTGCRRGEIYGLRKDELDAHNQCLRFGETKTGQQLRPIGRAAVTALRSVPGNEGSTFIFPASRGEGTLTNVRLFKKACALAGLQGVSLHTLRHSFASVAHELGYSELTIAGLLGHRTHSVTSRYVHHVDRALVAAADRVASTILARLEGRDVEGAQVIEIGRTRV